MTTPVTLTIDTHGVATVLLNRPEVNNAYNDAMIAALNDGLDRLERDVSVRVVVVTGAGRHFQAGADLAWIDAVRQRDKAANVDASRETARAVERLAHLPVPVVAVVNGACFGGGTGIVAAADIAIASNRALFSITEVRWGLTAGIIVPQLIDAIGIRQLRRYALTAERFDAAEAYRIGLVHTVVSDAELANTVTALVATLLANGPAAMAATKADLLARGANPIDAAALDDRSVAHARVRQTDEAAEGLASFREKRAARWPR
jgi:methylglutaconyl-CoA hydratase